ncbi:serine/threonine-protein kinase UCNL-like [Andrographis paniculata]|uniref:serine/threonine-protein kinase UCNL-like n=1 Tax=Andrographis paniculata TaxID=175694 RepID=UPI0021E8DC73|nr:serine/threonine-protein kinase UCNL-like [Andrographis paniculata]
MENSKAPPPELCVDNLRVIKLLGKGATGTVFLVSDVSSDHPFALKVVQKSSARHHADRRARHEIAVLSRLAAGHPFLPPLIGFSEDRDFICWGIPYCPGGDLNALRHRQSDGVFSAAVIRFYVAEIVSAVEYLHGRGIVYRDLKPENILVQLSGHVTLTDFDLSRDLQARREPGAGRRARDFYSDREEDKPTRKKKRTFQKKSKSARVSPVSRRAPAAAAAAAGDSSADERCYSFVGTEEYLSPEVIRGDGHDFAVDWWAVGILAYEMLYGTTPFKGRDRKDTFRRILLADPKFMGKPNLLTDLIKNLLEKDPTRRLGYGGASEIKGHGFFRGLRWELLTEVSRPPFLPLESERDQMTGNPAVSFVEYFQAQPPPLRSPSLDETHDNVSLTEF